MRFFETIKVEEKTVEENRQILKEINDAFENTRLTEFTFKHETDMFKNQATSFLESVFKDAGTAGTELYDCLISVCIDPERVEIKVYGLKAIIELEKKAKLYLK